LEKEALLEFKPKAKTFGIRNLGKLIAKRHIANLLESKVKRESPTQPKELGFQKNNKVS